MRRDVGENQVETGQQPEKPQSTKAVKAEARAKRLKAALRANLRRRKSQAKVRDASGGDG